MLDFYRRFYRRTVERIIPREKEDEEFERALLEGYIEFEIGLMDVETKEKSYKKIEDSFKKYLGISSLEEWLKDDSGID